MGMGAGGKGISATQGNNAMGTAQNNSGMGQPVYNQMAEQQGFRPYSVDNMNLGKPATLPNNPFTGMPQMQTLPDRTTGVDPNTAQMNFGYNQPTNTLPAVPGYGGSGVPLEMSQQPMTAEGQFSLSQVQPGQIPRGLYERIGRTETTDPRYQQLLQRAERMYNRRMM